MSHYPQYRRHLLPTTVSPRNMDIHRPSVYESVPSEDIMPMMQQPPVDPARSAIEHSLPYPWSGRRNSGTNVIAETSISSGRNIGTVDLQRRELPDTVFLKRSQIPAPLTPNKVYSSIGLPKSSSYFTHAKYYEGPITMPQAEFPAKRNKFWRPFQSATECGQSFLSEVETPRMVTVNSYPLGVLFRVLQLTILTYLIGYVFIWKKSYQEFDTAESSVTFKIKGILSDNFTDTRKVWDFADFVLPQQENEAFFITTSVIHTANQSQTLCAEDPAIGTTGVQCLSNRDCPKGSAAHMGNGVRSGRCVPWNETLKTCQITAWCPLEKDETPVRPLLRGFGSITVLVKNHVYFPKFGVRRRNILETFNETYLNSCRFHNETDPLCPVFGLKDMVHFADEDFLQTATRGGIISFGITWDCNLDFGLEDCRPKYSFKRLDNKDDQLAKGWNFRHANHYLDSADVSRRTLMKVWGIRFVFIVSGSAGKFSAVNFAMDMGSGLGLLEIASFICERLLLRFIRPNTVLLEKKFVKL